MTYRKRRLLVISALVLLGQTYYMVVVRRQAENEYWRGWHEGKKAQLEDDQMAEVDGPDDTVMAVNQ